MIHRSRTARSLLVVLTFAILVPTHIDVTTRAAQTLPQAAVDKTVTDAVDSLRLTRDVRHLRIDQRSGHVAALFGDLGSLPSLQDAAKTGLAATPDEALAFVSQFAGALSDQEPASSLSLERETTSPLGTRFRFTQHVGEWPVFDAALAVHVNRTGEVFAVTSSMKSGLDPAIAGVRPAIDAREAFDMATAAVGVTADRVRTADVVPSQLGVVASGTGRLAWRVVVPAANPYGQWAVMIDAVTGEPIGEPESLVLSAGTAKVFVPNAIVSTGDTNLTDQNNAASAVPESSYSTVNLPGLDTSGFVTGTYCSTDRTSSRVNAQNGDFTSLRRNDRGFDEVEAYWAIDAAQRYIQNSLGINNAANYQIHVAVHAFADDNSNYSSSGGGTGILNFGDGGVDDSQDAEIVWHEYGHAVLDNQAQISFNGESGAIHEGWGDYLAATMSTTVPGDSRFYPTIGEWDASSYDFHDPPYLRRVDGTKQYPRDVRGEVHDDGEIWSACLWGIHTALGRQTADSIIFNGNELFPSSVTFEDGAAAMVEADQQLFGGSHAAAISAAFAAHGIQVVASSPAISSVKRNNGKLVVNGSNFLTGSAVIEINGTALGSMKYPKNFRHQGISTRITSKDPAVGGLGSGVPVQITVLNPTTGTRSAPFAFTP